MDCVSPILDIVTRLWDCTANRAVYIRDLQENLNSLRDLKHNLEAIDKDVKGRADLAEQQQYAARTNQVIHWLESVQLKLKEIDAILQKGDEEIQHKCTLFQSIHTLVVLNLSNNRNLKELPVEIGALISLHYLNLSKTCVSNLPIEVKNLTQLRILLLDGMMSKQVVIPPGVISSLSCLEMYSSVEYHKRCKMDTKLIIEELECLEKITDVGLTFSSVSLLLKFMSSSSKLQSCITQLFVSYCKELHSLDISSSTMRRMEHLKTLDIRNCPDLREVKICFDNGERMQRSEPNCFRNLQILNIWSCGMENLTWLRYTPRLRFLYVIKCMSLEEIIAWDFAGSSEIEEAAEIFSNLEEVSLQFLPKLKSICRRAMPFPSLQDIEVRTCESLRKLPFNAESAKSTLKAINGRRDWWDKLEWEDEATNLAFTSKFQPLYSVMYPCLKACI
ncbi:hypothetical protein Q3G72_024528 [Acer saccharum]|nr:hypothetical protein Q3G72_024528 [Acer saccharum]